VCVIIPHWLQPCELGGSLSPLPTKPFLIRGNPWAAWWIFALGILLTFGVGVVIFVFEPRAAVPFVKLCLSLLHSLIKVAYSHLDELRSNLILFLTVVCVRNNPFGANDPLTMGEFLQNCLCG
jgi:hypothetical protein